MPAPAHGARFRIRPGLVVTSKGEARFLTDLGTGQVWELNETAALIVEAAGQGRSAKEIAAVLAERYPEVPRSEVERDLHDLLGELLRSGMLEPLPQA
jgi:hypothetical protein